ncbi:SCARECROW-like 13 [Abeliophyllum distichum]|uniref:SCARECROW-like 13 n=1 Tax=Abeliophyllum distichum TaxID=126358 RepID=A0ABD1QJ10_9LAMI
MQASQEPQTSTGIHNLYPQPMQQIEPNCFSPLQILNSNSSGHRIQGTEVSFQNCTEQFFTLESTPATDYVIYNSPSAGSVSSNRSPFSPQCSQSYVSDVHHSSDNTYGSPLSGYSGVDDDNKLMHALMVLRNELLGPESEIDDNCSFYSVASQTSSLTRCNQILEMAPNMDLQQVLIACAEAVSESDIATAEALMDILERRVSVSGEPIERLSAYMLEGLRARLLSSGSIIYKKLKCKEITSAELISYMQVLYHVCPYYKFAYMSANVVIGEAMENENRIHIIDFQIAQGSQWVSLIQALARRPGGPPYIHITGVDDSQSAHARGGGLELVGSDSGKSGQVMRSAI